MTVRSWNAAVEEGQCKRTEEEAQRQQISDLAQLVAALRSEVAGLQNQLPEWICQYHRSRFSMLSILLAMMKSFSCNPLIFLVLSNTVA